MMHNATRRLIGWTGIGIVALTGVVGGTWMFSLPAALPRPAPPPIPEDEAAATRAALAPPKRQRPVVAVVGLNDATEATDYLMSYGVLRRSGVADAFLLSTAPGAVQLYPALTVEPDATIAAFDARYPDGADYVIVPAMSRDDDPEILAWLRTQAAGGAVIIGVCAGAKVVAASGLLDGRRATTHWYFVDEILRRHPTVRYVPDRRIVADRGVITTTGITASLPMSLTLVDAIAGRDKAEALARELGVARWDARHDSEPFQLTRPFALTVMGNAAAFWNREQLGLELRPDLDEVSLALVADAWSRTYRSRVVTFASAGGAHSTQNGVRVIPDRVADTWPAERRLPAIDQPPAQALEWALRGIASRYGTPTRSIVAMQLEYPEVPGSVQ